MIINICSLLLAQAITITTPCLKSTGMHFQEINYKNCFIYLQLFNNPTFVTRAPVIWVDRNEMLWAGQVVL